MSLISLPYTFTNDSGSIPLADLDANFAAILAVVNGGIDQTNLSSSFNPVFSSLTVNGPASISGTLNAGATTLASLTVSGNETVNGNLTVLGSISQSGSSFITAGSTTTGYNLNPVTGQITQWTQMTSIGGATIEWTFPEPFPNGVVTAQATQIGGGALIPILNSATKTSIMFGGYAYNGGSWALGAGLQCYIVVVGY